MPEASIPRSTVFADSTWRVTDTTALLADAAWNIDDTQLATLGVGMAVQREPRVRYFVGVRYIGEINSTIGTVGIDYDISTRYSLALNESFNFTDGENQNANFSISRKFEQFVITVSMYLDQIEDEGGISFSISPRNFPGSGLSVSNGARGRY